MHRFWAVFVLSLAALLPAPAHEIEQPEGPKLLVNVWVRNSGVADIWTVREASVDEDATKRALTASLGCGLDEAGGDSSGDEVELWAECAGPFNRSGLMVRGGVNLGPLRELADEAGVRLLFHLGHSRVAYSSTIEEMGEFHPNWGHGYYNADFSRSTPPERVSLAFGYRESDLLWAGVSVILTVFGLVPVVIWLRKRALRRLEAGDDGAWFGFVIPLNFIALFNWAVWWASVSFWEISFLPQFVLDQPYFGSVVWDFARNAAWIWAPAIGAVLAVRAAAEAAAKLARKKWTRSGLTKMTIGGLAAIVVPTLMIFTGINAMVAGNVPAGVTLIAGAVVGFLFGLAILQRYQGFTPIAVTSGELRDRVFELAKQADVDLRQLFVIPQGLHDTANAFAVGSRTVMLSESLLRGLTKAEIDAVVGHELSHLKKKHPWIQLPLMVIPMVVVAITIEVLAPHAIPGWSYGFLLTVGVTASMGVVSRAHERTADAEGVVISGDPEAFITGMVKLARLSALPLDWGRTADAILTHPSMRQRIEAAARAGGIASDRLADLVENPPEKGESYEVPNVVVEGERVFSQQARNYSAARKSITGLCGLVLLPATLVTIDHELGLIGLSSAVWLAACVLVTGFGMLLLERWEAPLGAQMLAKKLRSAVGRQGFPAEQALVVGLGPHDGPRVYDNCQIWDAGCLFLFQDRLAYVGEETRFALRRDEIESIELRPYRPRLAPEQMVVIRWRDRKTPGSGAFYLQRFEARRGRDKFKAENEITKRLRAWKTGTVDDGTVPAVVAALSAPGIPEVSADSYNKMYNAKMLTWSLLFAAGVGIASSLVLGFGFGAIFGTEGHAWKVIALSLVAVGVAVWNDRPLPC
jgi:STE24 endopeptidase